MVVKFILGFCLVVLTAPVASGQSGGCQEGWTRHGASCYHFSHDIEDWRGAMYICNLIGGILVEVETVEENNYLWANSVANNVSYWMGLTDVVEEGVWQWMTSHAKIGAGDFSDWSPGKPNNYGGEENCALFDIKYTGHWNDDPCTDRLYYVCEAKPMMPRE